MPIRVALNHKTSYTYDREVSLSPQVIRLRPAPHCRTPILSYSLKVNPQPHFLNWQQDPLGNFLARVVFPQKMPRFEVEVDLVAEMTVINPFDFFLETAAEEFPFVYEPGLAEDLTPYLKSEPAGPMLAAFVNGLDRKPRRTLDFLPDLNRLLQSMIRYGIRLEPGVQSCEQTLELGSGSCRDTAWLLVQTLRHLGLAARFVSGYLIQLTADIKSLDGPTGPEHDFTDLHAWTEVYLPGAGWVGLDPTSGLFAGEGHIPLAATPDPVNAAPVTGATDPCETTFGFAVSVQRIHEDPRVTLPYTEPQWAAIEALGHRVDADLQAGDVRLTMGGEPTFVSSDDMEGAEWNLTAVGPTKRRLAGDLLQRLKRRFAPGGLLHYGQGKWYPGEPLPRWALTCYWRIDGLPIWRNPALFALEGVNYGHGEPEARRFMTALAQRLGLDPRYALPAHEDAWYYLWRERQLPTNVDPLDSKLEKPEERQRLARIFAQGLDKVVGYAIPVRWQSTEQVTSADGEISARHHWLTGRWFFRRENMFLIPGDSPLGFRLPLDSFPWVAPEEMPQVLTEDPFAPRQPLPDYHKASAWKPQSAARSTSPDAAPLAAVSGSLMDQALDPREAAATWTAQRRAAVERTDPAVLAGQPFTLQARGNSQTGIAAEDQPGDLYRLNRGFETEAIAERPALGRLPESRGQPRQPPERFVGMPGNLQNQNGSQPLSYDSIPLGQSAPWIVRTALCVEPREGRLHVFLPPVERLEQYLELVAVVEDTAAALHLPVVVEGYTPPHDPRIKHVKVTPDPGVIEVNVQPAESWDELVQNTTGLYEDARQSRLCAEKFMLDGKHSGTGGGNHVVLGGPTPADSPFLRRPDLLRSLIGYWHNHPSLSYLFSGMFLGPTSQAPRVDEARNDALYEMEIAFRQVTEHSPCPPWTVDRIFRNLLVDVSGNTHRAEFCIDKLYSPDSATGRLGLVEFRAFEMPPHARMSLTQQLLIRSLVAWFWKAPYTARLARWGTSLHDRFLLPHFVKQDFDDVLYDLRQVGYPLESEWFAPHYEFRFPKFGGIAQRGVELEIRQAIEPWHVMGEEPAGGAMARNVDSSVERVEVKVRGMTDARYLVTCNGRPVPLHPTGTEGEFVAGVRYRAWQPPSCLHPLIGIHSPLVFDIVDRWQRRSIGGCTYHVVHPGGLSYALFPVNSNEAESRRSNRFSQLGHTGGLLNIAPEPVNREFPLTLDLRRP